MSKNNLPVTAATCSQQPVSDIVYMRAIEVPASSYCDNHLDWDTSYIGIVILQQLCFVFHSYQSCWPANDSVVKTDLENCREALLVSEVCPSQTRHLASVSVMLFRSCHLILMPFVSLTKYFLIVRQQFCLVLLKRMTCKPPVLIALLPCLLLIIVSFLL